MSKVYGILSIELNAGVQPDEFIRFFNDQYAELGNRMGWKGTVLKGDRGELKGKLAVIWELPSVENRDRFVPNPGELSAEGAGLLEPDFSRLGETWDKLVANMVATDYVVQD